MKTWLRMLQVNLAMLQMSNLTSAEKAVEANRMNKIAGGLLFSSGPGPQRFTSQNKRRKYARQNRHSAYNK